MSDELTRVHSTEGLDMHVEPTVPALVESVLLKGSVRLAPATAWAQLGSKAAHHVRHYNIDLMQLRFYDKGRRCLLKVETVPTLIDENDDSIVFEVPMWSPHGLKLKETYVIDAYPFHLDGKVPDIPFARLQYTPVMAEVPEEGMALFNGE